MGTNSFSPETRELFDDPLCWECGKVAVDPHHIASRGSKRDDCESSPLNCCPLCRTDHEKGDINSDEKQHKYLVKTVQYLVSINYKLTEKDDRFINKYKDKYLWIRKKN